MDSSLPEAETYMCLLAKINQYHCNLKPSMQFRVTGLTREKKLQLFMAILTRIFQLRLIPEAKQGWAWLVHGWEIEEKNSKHPSFIPGGKKTIL